MYSRCQLFVSGGLASGDPRSNTPTTLGIVLKKIRCHNTLYRDLLQLKGKARKPSLV